jgi:hypothetical protein
MISMGAAIALSCDVTCAFRALTSIHSGLHNNPTALVPVLRPIHGTS